MITGGRLFMLLGKRKFKIIDLKFEIKERKKRLWT
jgi:hypothetical protein